MYRVEMRMRSVDLPDMMAAMRTWLDQHRSQPSEFTCRDGIADMLVAVAFQTASEGEAFAGRFGGRLHSAEYDLRRRRRVVS